MGCVASTVSSLWSTSPLIVVGGAAVLCIGGCYGIYKLYKYCSKTEKVSEAKVSEPITSAQQINKVSWKPLIISDQELKRIQILTKEMFSERAQQYLCPITHMIPIQPMTLGCCRKCFQKVEIQKWISKNHTCPSCRKQRTKNNLTWSVEREDAIEMFRFRIRRTLLSLQQENKAQWEKDIDRHFGIGYVKNHL